MLGQQSILVVEDDPYLALDLQQTIEDLDGRVVGPTRKLSEAATMLETEPVNAAIIDCHVQREDMLLLADMLAHRRIPFVLHTAAQLPRPAWSQHDDVPLLIKPVQPRTVVACLVVEMRKAKRA